MVLPIIEELAEEVTDVKICKVNVDEQNENCKGIPRNVHSDIDLIQRW